jgi:hypothetical protein
VKFEPRKDAGGFSYFDIISLFEMSETLSGIALLRSGLRHPELNGTS